MIMKVLAIGNSFSQDATRYLNRMAKENGIDLKTVNLAIGGCALKTHYYNMLEDAKKYLMEFNGFSTGFYVSIKEALMSDEWDYITIQQASHFSYQPVTYQPYLSELVSYIKKYCPHSKILVHQTWAYEDGSERLNVRGYETSAQMFADIEKAYAAAAQDIQADGLIPSGKVLQACLAGGMEKVQRDTFHASLGAGRYALSLTWLCYLTGKNPEDVVFTQFEAPITEEEIRIVKKAVAACVTPIA
jgi:hypothetical protein